MAGRDGLDKHELGATVLEYLARKMEASLEQREHIDPQRVLDIQFNDFIADNVGTVERIYDYFNMPMSGQTAKLMQDYAEAHTMGKHGSHDYQLEEYGLSEQKILDRFGFYIERFDIPLS